MADISENLRKVPPQNLEAELSILGAILIENDAIHPVLEAVVPDDLYRESHRKIFRAMIDLWDRNEPIDAITLSDHLKSKGELEAVGGSAYLTELSTHMPTAANVGYYARIVREKAILRRLVQASTEIATRGLEESGNVDEFLDDAERVIFEISEKRIRSAFVSVAEAVKDSIKRVEELYARKELITGVPTGYHDLDQLTAGLQRSDLIIVAGRPSMGKTAFALNIAVNAAGHNIGVAVFSLEMSTEQLALRMLCSEGLIDYSRLRTGRLDDSQFGSLVQAAHRLECMPIHVDDTPAISILELRAKVRRLARDTAKNIGLVVIDYLQLMRGMGGASNREQEISEISRSLKALAKELNVPVIALSQLNRRLEERTDKRPQLADLRESGAIEQDADLIMFIYRDEVYKKRDSNNDDADDMTGIAEIIIGKHRNGPVDTVKLTFRKEYTRFDDYSGREEDEYFEAEEY